MRRKISFILIYAICVCISALPLCVSAQENIPTITAISFKNAVINEAFRPDVHEYGITLDNNKTTPTIESYQLNGDADIFITYVYDDTNHQTGLTATLQYDTGSTIYNFKYLNPPVYDINSNNLLAAIQCTYGELSPKLNDKDTSYKLYIPSDLTQLTITPVTQDMQAYCKSIDLTLDENQTPKITLYCVASDGSKREYLLEIKRVDKTVAQVKEEMEMPDYTSFVDGTRLHQRPEFIITVCAAAGGILIIYAMFKITKKIAVNPYDKDEKPFYSPIE